MEKYNATADLLCKKEDASKLNLYFVIFFVLNAKV